MDIYLDRLELQGFKSFPDKTTLKMHRGITAVVGPNGCGKSNIVDSILWVLGEQRIKNLRGENNEDLIFNGSSSKKPLGMTEVGAFFANNQEEIYIARRFFRTGEGKYILNERYCRNKDIQDILYQLRLGGRNYFIFEQGSIEKLVSLKPSEKRLLIEEAAGIAQYLLRKKETANKLIITQQNLDNLQILIVDKENRLKDLRNQVNFVKRYRNVKNDKVNFLKTLLVKKNNSYLNNFDLLKTEIEKLINNESFTSKEIYALEKELIKLEEQRWKIDKDLKLLQQQIFEYNKKIISGNNEIERSKQSEKFKTQRIKEIKKSIETNQSEIKELAHQIQSTEKQIDELEAQSQQEASGHDKTEDILIELNDRLDSTHSENAGLKSDFFNIQSELSRINNKIKDIDKRISRIDNEVETKNNFVNQLQNQISSDEIKDIQASIDSLIQEKNQKESSFSHLEKKYQEKKSEMESLKNQVNDLKNEIRNLENQKRKYLEIKKKIVGETPNKKEADIPNHGYLQNIIHSDKKYHQLLENFYYEEMDALMVSDHHVLFQQDIKKKKMLFSRKTPGVSQNIQEKIQKEKGFISWIWDLFDLSDENLKVFLKNGVLVEDLKVALHIFTTYGIDVVTENAEVINQNGLLVFNRDKGILDVLEEIREIEFHMIELSRKHEDKIILFEKIKKDLPTLSQQVDDRRSELRKYEKELLQKRTSLETLEKTRNTNLKRVESTQAEIELLRSEKDKLQDEFEALDLKNGELEDNYKYLREKRDKYQEEVQSLKEKINHLEKEFLQKENNIKLIKEKINSAKSRLKSFHQNTVKINNTTKNNELEILSLEKDLDQLNSSEETTQQDLVKLDLLKKQQESDVQIREKEFNALNISIKEKTARINQLRSQLENIKENKKKFEIELSSIKKDLFQLEEIAFKELNSEIKNLDAVPEFLDTPLEELETEIQQFDERLIKMRDSNRLNFSAEAEFEILTKDYNFLLTQREDVLKSIEDMNEAIRKIDHESRISFMESFEQIRENFKLNFQILFEGGEAEMSLMDESDVLETGLDIKAQPPGKRLLSLNLLSGGEKTLTSLAFLFALFQYKPSPFCVFDEVDASLDEANIQRFLKFLHKLKKNTQFLIITHNFKTMEEADFIYGITMNEPGISTIYSMKMADKTIKFS